MKQAETARDVEIRPYRDGDEPAVLELLRVSLGRGPAGDRTPELFRWKHVENPFGRSLMLVAAHEDGERRIVSTHGPFDQLPVGGIDGHGFVSSYRGSGTGRRPRGSRPRCRA